MEARNFPHLRRADNCSTIQTLPMKGKRMITFKLFSKGNIILTVKPKKYFTKKEYLCYLRISKLSPKVLASKPRSTLK